MNLMKLWQGFRNAMPEGQCTLTVTDGWGGKYNTIKLEFDIIMGHGRSCHLEEHLTPISIESGYTESELGENIGARMYAEFRRAYPLKHPPEVPARKP